MIVLLIEWNTFIWFVQFTNNVVSLFSRNTVLTKQMVVTMLVPYLKTTLRTGVVPALVVDGGEQLVQSAAIMRYIGR